MVRLGYYWDECSIVVGGPVFVASQCKLVSGLQKQRSSPPYRSMWFGNGKDSTLLSSIVSCIGLLVALEISGDSNSTKSSEASMLLFNTRKHCQ